MSHQRSNGLARVLSVDYKFVRGLRHCPKGSRHCPLVQSDRIIRINQTDPLVRNTRASVLANGA
jgi:hypothetical protein